MKFFLTLILIIDFFHFRKLDHIQTNNYEYRKDANHWKLMQEILKLLLKSLKDMNSKILIDMTTTQFPSNFIQKNENISYFLLFVISANVCPSVTNYDLKFYSLGLEVELPCFRR